MSPGDKAFSILRADLDAQKAAKERTKCCFERELNARQFPPDALLFPRKRSGRRSAYYGSWLKEHDPMRFNLEYAAWRDAR